MDTMIGWIVILAVALYFYSKYQDQLRERFWKYMAEVNPYYKVATKMSLTSKALQKYTNPALIKKLMELESQVQALESQLADYQEKMQAHKDFQEEVENQESDKVKEILEQPPILVATVPIKVYDADGQYRGYLDSIRGSLSEAYLLVRTDNNELLIFGPSELQNLLLNADSLHEQVKSGVIMVAYDRYNNKVSPEYVRVTV